MVAADGGSLTAGPLCVLHTFEWTAGTIHHTEFAVAAGRGVEYTCIGADTMVCGRELEAFLPLCTVNRLSPPLPCLVSSPLSGCTLTHFQRYCHGNRIMFLVLLLHFVGSLKLVSV